MAKSILPFRFRVLHYASTRDTFTKHDLLRDLESEYAGEGQFTDKKMTLHTDSLVAVGMIETVKTELEGNDLLLTFKITDYGRDRLKYLPAEWK
ncbi:MAG TPA: hypothetical protein PKD52_06415 [Clostridiales bacterium]|nr:hypothetical protein [Clostridiales bacterium]